MQVTGIGWAGVLTEDFESTLRFFSDILGLSLTYRDDTKELAHFRFRSGQLFEVYGPSNRGRKEKYQLFNGPVLGFEVDDVQRARQEMIARGTRFITELESWENDMWTLFLGTEHTLFEILRAARNPAGQFDSVLRICRARFSVPNFSDAVQFFSQVMEMPFARESDNHEFSHCSLPSRDLFAISRSSTRQDNPTITIGFEVDDMSQARKEIELRGLAFIGSAEVWEDGSIRSQLCGPDGYVYEIISDLKHE